MQYILPNELVYIPRRETNKRFEPEQQITQEAFFV